jgi:catechol 2,3-dioxygenase-like lactoylglutathione lyase family enzyme
MNVLGLHHVQITIPVGTEAEARRFYTGVLGLREIEKPDPLKNRGGFWLMAGNSEIHVGVEDGVDRNKTKAHLAYLVDDLEAFRKKLEAEGIEVKESIPIPGVDRFEFRDPFGNRVELLQRLK